MGKSRGPATPDYKGQAIATANAGKYSEVTPFGSVNWSMRPGADPNNPLPGDSIRTTLLSPEQQALLRQSTLNQMKAGALATGQLSQLSPDNTARQALQDALYRRNTQYYDQNFGDRESALRSQLLNSGLSEGSEGYQREMRNFGQQRDTAYADASDRAVIGAEQQSQANQSNAVNRLAQILAMSRGESPQSTNNNVQGPDFLGAAQQSYNSDMARTQQRNQQAGNTMSTLANLGMMWYLFSDRRLKSDITRAGVGAFGLPVYDYEIFGYRDRGYMADEVELVLPEAVATGPGGWKMVDYSLLGGRP